MEESKKAQLLYSIAKRVAVVALVFATILSSLLIVNYIQTKSSDPLNSAALNRLMLELRDNQDDESLKEEIRALDLLARKAYFVNQWQLRVGGFLLFFFVLSFLIAVKYMSSLSSQLPDFSEGYNPEESWENKLLARKIIIFAGLAFFAVALLLSVLSEDDFIDNTSAGSDIQLAAQSYPDIDEIRSNWPNFRGPEGIGLAYESELPTKWDGGSGENVLWKTNIPLSGYNSPVIWGKKLFLTGADNNIEMVYCIDTDTGTILWETEIKDVAGSPAEWPKNSKDTGIAAPTMATDGVNVFALFGTGDVACLDFDGAVLWAKNLGLPENHYGHSSSLISWRDLLLVQYDQGSGGRFLALDTSSGETRYDIARNTDISWASPILVNTGERDEIIMNASPDVVSHDPATGKELWRVECMEGEVAPSLAYADGMVFAVNEYAVLVGIKLGDEAELLWENEDDLSEVSSPVATADDVFVATSYGTVSCFDAKTGERYWFEDLPNGFYSSLILAGENIYLTDMSGKMYIFKAAREYSLVGTCELGERAVAVPAFLHGRIYIRGIDNLYCIGE